METEYTWFIDEFRGQQILHLAAEADGEIITKMDFGRNKAIAIADHIDFVIEFATTGKLAPNKKDVKLELFKRKPILLLPMDAKYPLSFGLAKAELLINFVEIISQFADGKTVIGDEGDQPGEDEIYDESRLNRHYGGEQT